MTTADSPAQEKAWALIETERRRERFVRRVCVAAWGVTLGLALLFAALTAVSVAQMVRASLLGAVPWMTAVGAAMPLMGVLWTLSLLVAALSTVGVFLQQRTASLAEIRLRLAALEEMLGARHDAPGDSRPTRG
jgi:hypothetical protein